MSRATGIAQNTYIKEVRFYREIKPTVAIRTPTPLFADIGEECKDSDTGVQSTCIAEVFQPQKTMLFLFDYGDDWMFPVTCTGGAETKPFKRPKLLSTTGEPPEQYPESPRGP